MSVFQLSNNVSASASLGLCSVEWPGGDGLIVVDAGATFTGSSQLNLNFSTAPPLSVSGALPVSTIAAPGVYPFIAPKGLLSGTAFVGPGDSISNLTVWAVSMSGSDL